MMRKLLEGRKAYKYTGQKVSAELIPYLEDLIKQKEAEIQLLIKRRNIEIQNLVKERRKLRKVLVMTRETYELRILSNKILHINMRINRLIKLNDALLIYPEEYENQIIKVMI